MKRRSKTIAQQCRYYEVDNIFEYMVSVYLNGNISTFGELYKELWEKEAFWRWVEGNNTQLTQDAYSLVKSFQSDYIGSYASREDFAEELAKMENELSDFALNYFDFSKYANDLFDMDFWYKDGYVFRNN